MAIETNDLYRVMDNIRVRLPGALDGAIQLELFNVITEFLDRTNAWQESISFTVPVNSGRGASVQIVPNAGRINRLLWVRDGNGLAMRMAMQIPGVLVFVDPSDGTATWTAQVAINVNDPVPTSGKLAGIPNMPGWIVKKYEMAFIDGVLGMMMTQVAKPYSNPKASVLHFGKYKQAMAHARAEVRHQNLYGGQTWRYPYFAAGTQRVGGIG